MADEAQVPLLAVRDLAVVYGARGLLGRGNTHQAVDGVSIEVRAGEALAIVGESGCGKSTLARAIMGLVPYASGEIQLAGERVTARRTPAQRRVVQMVFQDPYSSLNPRMTVGQTLREVVTVHRMRTGAAVEARTLELLDMVNLPRTVADSSPRSLSGGQRQRVSIARALATEPKLLIADEPVSALDVSVQAAILNLFADLRDELSLALVMISHNLAVVRQVSDRIAVMYAGAVVETGPTAQVLERPHHDYTRKLLASVPSLHPPAGRTTSSAAQPANIGTGAEQTTSALVPNRKV